ncbi:hypothetical protein ACHQM5_006580 [Ranunculus cassubicifolius]
MAAPPQGVVCPWNIFNNLGVPQERQQENQQQCSDSNQQVLNDDSGERVANPEVNQPRAGPSSIRAPTYLERLRGMQPQHIDVAQFPGPEMEDGIPSITLPKAVVERGKAYCQFSLIGRLDFKKFSVERARSLTAQVLAPRGVWNLTPLGKGFFMLRLDNRDDFVRIWAKSWKFGNQVVKSTQWYPEFDPEKQVPSTSLLWVRFPTLNQQYWDYEALMRIGRGVGNPVGVDQRTLSRELGYFANVLIEIDLSKPIADQVSVKEEDGSSFLQDVEIQNLPTTCSHCKGIGHTMYQCRGLLRAMQDNPREERNGGDNQGNREDTNRGRNRNQQPQRVWQQVQRRQRNNNNNNNGEQPQQKGQAQNNRGGNQGGVNTIGAV